MQHDGGESKTALDSFYQGVQNHLTKVSLKQIKIKNYPKIYKINKVCHYTNGATNCTCLFAQDLCGCTTCMFTQDLCSFTTCMFTVVHRI